MKHLEYLAMSGTEAVRNAMSAGVDVSTIYSPELVLIRQCGAVKVLTIRKNDDNTKDI